MRNFNSIKQNPTTSIVEAPVMVAPADKAMLTNFPPWLTARKDLSVNGACFPTKSNPTSVME